MKLMIQPDAGLVPVVQAIRRAKKTVDVAIFRLNRAEIETALGAAVQRGVKVRALVANTNRGGEERLRKLEQRLLALGVTVARSGDDLVKYHGKYLIVDDTLYLLGFNYTKADTTRSRSFGIQTRNGRAVKDAQKLFECDLTKQPYEGSKRSALVVSPENSRESLFRFVRGARKRLAIYDQRLDDRSFLALLKKKIDAGVQVQVIGRASKLESGTQVRALTPLRLHVRAIIRDGSQAFVGSQSLRRLELDRRREVGLIITNPAVTKRMLEVFERDWEDSVTPKIAKVVEKIEKKEGKEALKDDGKGDKKERDQKTDKSQKAAKAPDEKGERAS